MCYDKTMNYKVGFKRKKYSREWLKVFIVTANHPGHAVVVAENRLYDAGIRKPFVVGFVKPIN